MELTTPRTTVADNVRAAMARRRVTQNALAADLDMTQQALSRRLTGAVAFNVDELHAAAAALDVPVTSLLAEPVAATGT